MDARRFACRRRNWHHGWFETPVCLEPDPYSRRGPKAILCAVSEASAAAGVDHGAAAARPKKFGKPKQIHTRSALKKC